MKERPIIFNDEMVRAILDGRKTQTRRICKTTPVEPDGFASYGADAIAAVVRNHCPYGKPGDRLWVRETVADIGPRLTYRADRDDGAHCQVVKWTPSIHMPRWASRITLEITNVRVERVQDISGEDAIAEGVHSVSEYGNDADITDFSQLWNSIYGPDSWAANPWVWVIEFRRVEE